MENKLLNIYNHLYLNKSIKDPRKFIEFVENDMSIFDYDFSKNHDNYVMITKLIADYAIALFNAGYLTKSIKYFDIAILNMRNDTMISNSDLMKETLYESLIFHRGMTNYNLKKYRDSKPDFKLLLDNFPDNDRYKNWYNGSVDNSLKKLQWGLLTALFLTSVFALGTKPEDGVIDKVAFYGLTISLIGSLVVMMIRRKIRFK